MELFGGGIILTNLLSSQPAFMVCSNLTFFRLLDRPYPFRVYLPWLLVR
ncbi:MAG: hypothetical protein Q8764_02130 [Pigeon pea little leaf phytoplasma]|nr:hypothetical protein [Pigeon pea little leaf phytoplasma]MDV3196953.1 hypothetical protein [Pigeon pea little leaf phytoplasma]